MALVKSKKTAKENVKVSMEKPTLSTCMEYCTWAGVELGEFLEQAAELVFKKDKAWNKHKSTQTETQIE